MASVARALVRAYAMSTDDFAMLTENTVAGYLRSRRELRTRIDADSVTVREVGDGNLNLVFVCRDALGASLVLKQAIPFVRVVGPSWPLTVARADAEARGLVAAGRASPTTSVELFAYDPLHHVLAMEDLSALTVWRTALNRGEVGAHAAADCGRHLARLFLDTNTADLSPAERATTVERCANPAMCEITNDLVFIEPFIDHANNRFDDALRPQVEALRTDARLRAQVERLRRNFATSHEALIHGDLHTGSVMIALGEQPATKVIDAEFCFYGPIALDLAMLLGNLLFASIRAACLGDDRRCQALAALPGAMWGAFADEVRTRADSGGVLGEVEVAEQLARIARDAFGFGGCEVIRRIVGFAKVSDIETLPDEPRRLASARALGVAQRWLTDPRVDWGSDLLATAVPDDSAR